MLKKEMHIRFSYGMFVYILFNETDTLIGCYMRNFPNLFNVLDL